MTGDRARLVEAIAREIHGHVPCGFEICERATRLVPGEGSPDAGVVIVGEAAGLRREDVQHLPWLHNPSLCETLLEDARALREAMPAL